MTEEPSSISSSHLPTSVVVVHSQKQTTTMSAGAAAERKVRVAELTLRCLLCALGAMAAALLATDTQSRTFFTLQKKATYTDVKALAFLVVADAVAAGYSLLQAARCFFCAAALRRSRVLAWCVFSCDQALAYVALAAVAAALQASVISKRGLPVFQWMEVCGMYDAFCRRAGAGVASGLGAGLTAVGIAFLSAFNLFRLYGKGARAFEH